ncbi:MAG: hypothetical protein KF760_30380 [Candidatus Eremiobacteraeota bacterium]|nr:hypothetical protein [Candidatus Eremiobacteraeota bacterium]MCW5868112.1 hypothetical protein [Candidatus Eremiobacteraeota bacterium]
MPTHTELFHEAGVCSYSQSWTPIWRPGAEEVTRGCLAILVSETNQQPVFTEVVAQPLDFDSQIAWLDKCFKQAGAPTQLLVPTEALAEVLRPRCPNSEIFVDPAPRHHGWIRESLWPADAEAVPFSILAMLGEKKARELYVDCEHFLVLEPWNTIKDDEVFRFTSHGKEYGVVVGGSTRFQDGGISVFASVKTAIKQSSPPISWFGPGNALVVHYRDLNFLDRCNIRIPQRLLPRLKFPMITPDKRDRRTSLKDLRFLVRQLPEMLHTGKKLLEEGKRRLEWTELRIKKGRAGLFPAYWDRLAS